MSNKKIIFAGLIGSMFEFYDFTLYFTLASVISNLFFPMNDPIASLMLTFVPYTIGFFVSPLGSLIFGHIGDKFGRKTALAGAITLMGVPTFCIGILPEYSQIGILAPITLCILRGIQGLSLGGEYNGSMIFMIEHNKKHAGFMGSIIIIGGAIGSLVGSFFSILVLTEGMPQWAWRIPFIVGIVVSFLGYLIRSRLMESPEFLAMAQSGKTVQLPIREVFANNKIKVMITMLAGFVNLVNVSNVDVMMNVYSHAVLGATLSQSIMLKVFTMTLFGIMSSVMGAISDRCNRSYVIGIGMLLLFFSAMPIYKMLSYGFGYQTFLAGALLAVLCASFNGVTGAFLQELFPPQYRYTGISFGYMIGVALGSMTPTVSFALMKYFGAESHLYYIAPSFCLMAGAVAGLVCAAYRYAFEVEQSINLNKRHCKIDKYHI